MMNSNYKFVNPYNFMPLTQNVERGTDVSGTYTGVINYTILTKTPLIVPNTSNSSVFSDKSNVKDHKSYEFYSYTDLTGIERKSSDNPDRPIIPGSEVRGMFRSNYEILTQSCMSSIDDDKVMSKRTHERFKAGIIVRKPGGKYDLYSAIEHICRTEGPNSLKDSMLAGKAEYRISYEQNSLSEGQKVYFRHAENGRNGRPFARNISKTPNDISTCEGYIIKGEKGIGKHVLHVFQKNELIVKDVSLTTLEKVLNEYAGYKEYKANFQSYKRGEGDDKFPVYYSLIKETDSLFLSPAQITREIYSRKIRGMIGDSASCDKDGCLCRACSLFGTVGSNGLAKASQIRFTDLVQIDKQDDIRMLFDKVISLAPLSAPKINNMEFYLERPDGAVFWTYDYYIDTNGNVHKNSRGINGRKFYWHNLDMKELDYEKSNQNYSVRPVKADVRFTGKVFFKDINKEELDTLIYLINCGENVDIISKGHGYKLGAAKPLGYGSIATAVDSVLLKKIRIMQEGDVERILLDYDEIQTPNIDANVKQKFTVMTDFEAVRGHNVDYPRNTEGGNIYDWFGNNHKAVKNGTLVKSPLERKQEFYDVYMEPLSFELKSTGKEYQENKPKNSNSHNQSNILHHTDKRNEMHDNNFQNRGEEPKCGVMYQVIVTNVTDYGYAFIKGEAVPRNSCIKNAASMKAGERVTVRFKERKTSNNMRTMYYFELVKK